MIAPKADTLERRQEVRRACDVDECQLLIRVEAIEHAFPDGTTAHREAHIAWMEAKRAEKAFWEELKLDLAKKGVWSLLILILGLLFLGVTLKLGLTPKL